MQLAGHGWLASGRRKGVRSANGCGADLPLQRTKLSTLMPQSIPPSCHSFSALFALLADGVSRVIPLPPRHPFCRQKRTRDRIELFGAESRWKGLMFPSYLDGRNKDFDPRTKSPAACLFQKHFAFCSSFVGMWKGLLSGACFF